MDVGNNDKAVAMSTKSPTVHRPKTARVVAIRSNPNPMGWVLTRKEYEVMLLVCEGLKAKEIAERLHRSVKTVEKHATNVRVKLGVHSILHAAILFDRRARIDGLEERALLLQYTEKLKRAIAALEAP